MKNANVSSGHQFWLSKKSHALIISIIFLLSLATGATASSDPADICDKAAHAAATEVGIPVEILKTITRVETGRGRQNTLQPWPWTVNMQGRGVWFDNELQAKAYVFRHFKAGIRLFDIGCFQINFRWHGENFNSIDEMFDPYINARYAAQFLLQLRNSTENWTGAIGAYHSRTAEYAKRYVAKYEEVSSLPDTFDQPSIDGANKKKRRAKGPSPLIPKDRLTHTTSSRPRGSLFPAKQGSGLGLFANRKDG